MGAAQLVQSGDADSVPFITVSTDSNGGTCWVVVGLGTQIRCYSGQRAIDILRMMLASRGIPTP